MRRELRILAWLVALLVLGALAWWIHESIEWVDIDVPVPPHEKAVREPFPNAAALVVKLGGRAESKATSQALPPPGATLVLSSRYWTFFPERVQALDRWVRAGGRLVLLPGGPGEPERGVPWLPIRTAEPPRVTAAAASAAASGTATASNDDDDDDDDEAPPAKQAKPPARPASSPTLPKALSFLAEKHCEPMHEPEGRAAAYGAPRSYVVCGYVRSRLRSAAAPLWSLDAADGRPVLLSVAHGAGTVTLSAISFAFDDGNVLERDGPLAFASALSLHAGDLVWFMTDDRRTPLLARLWTGGHPALLLAFAALGLALWRGMARFGPPAAEPPRGRRSIGEQIRRTAAFIAAGDGGTALHRAAVRALEDAARRSITGYAALLATEERAAAIALASNVDAAALAAALAAAKSGGPAGKAGIGRRRQLAGAIGTLEQARRALLAGTARSNPTSPRASP